MTSDERHEARYQRRKAKREEKKAERSRKYSEWDNVFGFRPLINGYYAVAKASRKRTKTQVWMANLAVNTRKEQNKLKSWKWNSRGFNHFFVVERGKKREILSVHISEKGIQNSFSNNCLIPILRPHLIYDNGASLKGKGTDFALDRFTKHLRDHVRKYGRIGAIYFYDFSGYFQNINNELLKARVFDKVQDENMQKMYEKFVDAFGPYGLGLGSQISQISAVFYPNEVDHLIKDKLRVKGYGRYMDDGYIICESEDRLKEIVKQFEEACEKLGIILNKKKCRIIKLHKQFIFLKTRFFITDSGKVVRRLCRKMSRNERHRLKRFKKFMEMGIMTYEHIRNSFHAWLLSLNRGKSFHVKLNAIRYFNNLFSEYPPYEPPKVSRRKHKELLFISHLAKGDK